jgi:hypothetical protein
LRLVPASLVAPSVVAPSAAASPGFAADDSLARPDAGLARGRWEAPAWMFWAVAAAALIGAVAWIALALRARKALR